MEEKKVTSINLIIIFFLSYSFYTIQVLTQQLFYLFSKQSVTIICLLYLLVPLITYFICKLINEKRFKLSIKTNFVYTLVSSLYLFLTLIISFVNISNIVILYYYNQTSFIILSIFLLLPLLYTILKGDYVFFSISSILLILYILFKYAYLSNMPPVDTYVFYNIFHINKNSVLLLILYSLPLILEPLLLINNHRDVQNKINIKFVLIFSSIMALIGIATVLRQTWEFGNLLDKIRFPYLESIKNINAGKFFENIDYYYLLSISVYLYTRFCYTIITIKRNYNLNKAKTFILIFLTMIVIYFLQSKIEIYEYSLSKILIFSSCCLLISLFLLPFMLKRRKEKNV